MTKLSSVVESGIVYEFRPPVEVGDQEVTTIAEMTRIALHGSEVIDQAASEAIDLNVNARLDAQHHLVSKEVMLNEILGGRHKVQVYPSSVSVVGLC